MLDTLFPRSANELNVRPRRKQGGWAGEGPRRTVELFQHRNDFCPLKSHVRERNHVGFRQTGHFGVGRCSPRLGLDFRGGGLGVSLCPVFRGGGEGGAIGEVVLGHCGECLVQFLEAAYERIAKDSV
jgi:hypothetical protein